MSNSHKAGDQFKHPILGSVYVIEFLGAPDVKARACHVDAPHPAFVTVTAPKGLYFVEML